MGGKMQDIIIIGALLFFAILIKELAIFKKNR
jgi:hypothetical protein